MTRNEAVMTWREVCGSDTVMAAEIVTGRMLEEFAARIEALAAAAEREQCAKLCASLKSANRSLAASGGKYAYCAIRADAYATAEELIRRAKI